MTAVEFFEMRREMGLTQSQLGLKLGYSRTQIARMERGISPVPKHVVIAINALWGHPQL